MQQQAVLYKFAMSPLFLPSGLFRFTQPASLNDPNEALPQILIGAFAPEDYEVAYSENRAVFGGLPTAQEELEYLMAPYPAIRLDEKRFPALWMAGYEYPTLRAEPFYTLEELDYCIASKAVELCREFADQNIGILSLTKNYCDSMWAYYGGADKGVAIAFDADHTFFTRGCWPVEYGVPIRASTKDGFYRVAGVRFEPKDIIEERIDDVPVALLVRKSPAWANEQEVRLLRPLSEATVTQGPDEFGKSVCLFEVPSEAVTRVTFGYRADATVIEDTLKIVGKAAKWKHLKVYRRKWTTSGILEYEITM